MPEVEGNNLSKIISEHMSTGSSANEMAEALTKVDGNMKEFAMNSTQAVNVLNLMSEAMRGSRKTFSDFSETIERTSIVMQAFGKAINDVSSGLKGATSSVDGFIVASQTLATKTLPNLIQGMALTANASANHVGALEKEMQILTKEAVDTEGRIKHKEIMIKQAKESDVLSKKDQQQLVQYQEALQRNIQHRNKLNEKIGETREKLSDARESMDKFGVVLSKTLGWITLVITAAVAMSQAYDNSIKAKREVLYMLGRLGAGYATNRDEMDKFDKSFTQISSRWGMLREEMAKAIAPLTALGVGVGSGGIKNSIAQVQATLQESAELTGMMMRGFGVDIGTTTKALGTLSTAFDLNGKALADTFSDIASQGQKSALGMTRYLSELTSMYEITRRYGGGLENSMNVLNAWGEEVKKGTISMEQLARLQTPGMMSLEQQGAIVTLMKQYAPTQAGKLGITGENIFDDIYKAQVAANNDKSNVFAQGIIEMNKNLVGEGRGTGETAILLQQFLKQTTGVQVPHLEAVNALSDPEKLQKLINPPQKKDPLNELLNESKESYKYTKTISERMVGSVETMRDIMIGTVQPALIKLADLNPEVAKLSDHASSKAQSYLSNYAESDEATDEEKFYIKAILPRLRKGKAVEGPLADKMATMLDKIVKADVAGRQKATGGYIPETAEYLLHAGEQVRRPGEGGGDVSVSLGGLSVTVGDVGDINGQVNEAFDRLKNETLREIEHQWEMAQNAH